MTILYKDSHTLALLLLGNGFPGVEYLAQKTYIYLTLIHIARLLSTTVVTLYIPPPPAPLSLIGNTLAVLEETLFGQTR